MTEQQYLARAADPTLSGDEIDRLWIEVGAFDFPLGTAAAVRIEAVLARNPNLTPERALACFGRHAAALVENPVFPLLFLERPNLANEAPVETLLRLTRRRTAPREVLELLTHHPRPQIAEAARLHRTLYGDASPKQVREALARLPVGGKEKLSTLHDAGLVPAWLVERHKLKDRKALLLPVPVAGNVREEPLTEHEHATFLALSQEEKHVSWDRRQKVVQQLQKSARDPKEKAEALRFLTRYSWLHTFLERNPATPVDALVAMGAGEALLRRTDVPDEIKTAALARQIERVATSGLVLVLSVAHTIGDTPLHESVLSTRWLRRLGVALNPRIRESDRSRLTDDANAVVSAVARDATLRERILSDGAV